MFSGAVPWKIYGIFHSGMGMDWSTSMIEFEQRNDE
jgi:hypothetical protein